jgi:hypothetical protein
MFKNHKWDRLEWGLFSSFVCFVFLLTTADFTEKEVGSPSFCATIMVMLLVTISFAVHLHIYLFRKYIRNKDN